MRLLLSRATDVERVEIDRDHPIVNDDGVGPPTLDADPGQELIQVPIMAADVGSRRVEGGCIRPHLPRTARLVVCGHWVARGLHWGWSQPGAAHAEGCLLYTSPSPETVL